MKKQQIIIFIMALLGVLSTTAQIIEPKENAVFEVNYIQKVSIDTIGGESFIESPMGLRVGKTSAMFYPQKQMFIDSLNYYANNAGKDLISECMSKGESSAKVTGWESEYLFRNVRDNKTMVCRHFATYHLGYLEETELPEWTIHPEITKEILGYECIYANSFYRGREWEAWFTPEIPFKEGPWKLAGLPGVVLSAQDSRGQYCYEANSIKTENLPQVGIFVFERRPLDIMADRNAYLNSIYHLKLKGKFMNQLSQYTKYAPPVVDKTPLYDLQETDFQH